MTPAVQPLEAIERDAPGPEAARRLWDGYVDSRPDATGYHRLLWRDVIRAAFGHATRYLVCRTGDAVTGVLPLCHIRSRLFGSYLVSLPYFNYGGILASDPASERALLQAAVAAARELGAGHLELRMTRPLAPGAAGGEGLRESSHKVAMVLDLPPDPEALWSGFKAKLRSQVRRAEREGLTTAFGGAELLDGFYDVFARNMRDLGTPVYARGLFAEVLARCPESRVCLVSLGRRPVAAGFLVGYRDRLEIPWASSLRRYNPMGTNMLLYWKVLEHAAGEKYRAFDFGRSSPDSGTYRFKAQWGARPVPFHWHYWLREGGEMPGLSPANPKYRLAIALWRRLPLAVTRMVGPRIVRGLP
jgi:serine/alanine adding enzyme